MSSPLITVIVAGTNEPSNADVAATAFIEGMSSVPSVTIEKVCLRDLHLAHFTLACYALEHADEADFIRIHGLIERSAGIVIASPVWNFSVPAHLKNLIDRMGSFCLDRETRSKGMLKDKPFALLYTGGAPQIAWNALFYQTTLHVSEAIKYFGGTVLHRFFEGRCVPSKGSFGCVLDQRLDVLARLTADGARFAAAAKTYAIDGSLPGHHRFIQKTCEFLFRTGNMIMYQLWKRQ